MKNLQAPAIPNHECIQDSDSLQRDRIRHRRVSASYRNRWNSAFYQLALCGLLFGCCGLLHSRAELRPMALRDNFAADLTNVFMDTNAMATTREFRISDGAGGFTTFSAPVIWDQEESKELAITKINGVFVGDVRCHIEAKYLPRIPLAGEIIYSPGNKFWQVIDATDEEGCYVLALSATRSKAGVLES